jgi:hypothetical protein
MYRILNGLFIISKWLALSLGMLVLVSMVLGFWCGIKAATRGNDYPGQETYTDEDEASPLTTEGA